MKDLKSILIRLLMLVILISGLNFLYKKTLYDNYKDANTEFVKILNEVNPDFDILYLGESSNITCRHNDTDRRSISEMIGSSYPDLIVDDITKPASHSGIYYHFLRAIPKDEKERTIIVTLNLRSFNTVWINSELETPLQKNSLLIYPYPPIVNRTLLSFKHYDQSTSDELLERIINDWENNPLPLPENNQYQNTKDWDKWMADKGVKDKYGKRDQKQTELACHYIKTYAFSIDTFTNPRIKDFNKIISLSEKRNWNLVFNLMAENTEKAQTLVGDELVSIMNFNANLLYDYFSNQGVTVVNNLNAVRDEQYVDQNWTTEHYAEIGRKTIAANVANSIKHLYPGHFKNTLNSKPDYHFTGFEKEFTGLHGLVKRTQEYAATGDFSAVITKDNIYSQAALFSLDSTMNSEHTHLEISSMTLRSSNESNATLIIEARKENKIVFWESEYASAQNKSMKQWKSFLHSIEITDELRNADLIKVYFRHEGGDAFYIDDFQTQLTTRLNSSDR